MKKLLLVSLLSLVGLLGKVHAISINKVISTYSINADGTQNRTVYPTDTYLFIGDDRIALYENGAIIALFDNFTELHNDGIKFEYIGTMTTDTKKIRCSIRIVLIGTDIIFSIKDGNGYVVVNNTIFISNE